MSADNKALVRRIYEDVFNKGDLAAVDELVTEDYVDYDPGSPAPAKGRAAFKQLVAGYRTAFPDLTFTIEDQIAEGDQVVSRWTAQGTQKGELMGIPPTGKLGTVTGISIERVANGKVAETRTNWDTLGLLQQLGVIPTP